MTYPVSPVTSAKSITISAWAARAIGACNARYSALFDLGGGFGIHLEMEESEGK